MSLPDRKPDHDFKMLRSDPVQGGKHVRRARTTVLIAATALVFGWLIWADYRHVEAQQQSWDGWTSFGKVVLLLLGAYAAWFLARFYTPRVLGTWWTPLLIMGAGWFARGFFETAMAQPLGRDGFYTGMRMLMWLALGFTVGWAVMFIHRRGLNRSEEEGV